MERSAGSRSEELTMQCKHCRLLPQCLTLMIKVKAFSGDYNKRMKTNKGSRQIQARISNSSSNQVDGKKNTSKMKELHSFLLPESDLVDFTTLISRNVEPTTWDTRGNWISPVEKDEGDALFKVWAHEPLKGLFMPLPAWIITPSSPVMCCAWYIGPHLLPLRFHLARSSKSAINKKTQACNKIPAQLKTTGSDPQLRLQERHYLGKKNWNYGQLPSCL